MKLKNILVAASVCGILAVAGNAMAFFGGGGYNPQDPIIVYPGEPTIVNPTVVRPTIVRPEAIETMSHHNTYGSGHALHEGGSGDLVLYDFGPVGRLPGASPFELRHYGSEAGGITNMDGAFQGHEHGRVNFGDLNYSGFDSPSMLPYSFGANTGDSQNTGQNNSQDYFRRPSHGGGYTTEARVVYPSSFYNNQPTNNPGSQPNLGSRYSHGDADYLGGDRELAHNAVQFALGHVAHTQTAPIYTTISNRGDGQIQHMPLQNLSTNHTHQVHSFTGGVGVQPWVSVPGPVEQ
jgi:hypothetical protein